MVDNFRKTRRARGQLKPIFGVKPRTPTISSSISRFVVDVGKNVYSILDRIEKQTLQDFEMLPDDPGVLFKIKRETECYRYNDLHTKSSFESLDNTVVREGNVIMSLGKEIWPVILFDNNTEKGSTQKCIRHALWKFLHEETIWFVYASDIKGDIESRFEKIVF